MSGMKKILECDKEKMRKRKSVLKAKMDTILSKKNIFILLTIAVFLVSAVGSASAVTVINNCNFNANTPGEYYVLGQDITCNADDRGITIGADDVTIDGYNTTDGEYYWIKGNRGASDCTKSVIPIAGSASESNPANHSAIINLQYDNLTIKNLEVEEFCTGIVLRGNTVDNNTVTGCKIHDNGLSTTITHGIHMVYTNECEITGNSVYNNDGTGVSGGCSGGGNGIFMYGEAGGGQTRGWYNAFTYNDLLDNTKSGFFMKHQCMHNTISNNNATGNGEGGIVPMCKKSKFNIIANNNMSNNTLFGFKTQGSNNTIGTDNIASNNGQYGIVIVSGTQSGGHGKYNDVTSNTACGNGVLDVSVTGPHAATNTFDENTCDNSSPEGLCEYSCPGVEQPDLIIEDIRPVRWCCCCIEPIRTLKGGDDSEEIQVMFLDDPELAKELGDEELRKEVAEVLAKDPKLAEEVAAKLAGDDDDDDDKKVAKELNRDPKQLAELCCYRSNVVRELADLLDTELTGQAQHEMSDQLDMIVGCGCCGGCCCDCCLTADCCCCCCGRFIAYKIANVGDTGAGWSLSNLTVNGRVRSVDIVRPLDAGQRRWEVFPCYRMWWWPLWPREVTVCADVTDWIAGSDETNNCRTEWFPPYVTPRPTLIPTLKPRPIRALE